MKKVRKFKGRSFAAKARSVFNDVKYYFSFWCNKVSLFVEDVMTSPIKYALNRAIPYLTVDDKGINFVDASYHFYYLLFFGAAKSSKIADIINKKAPPNVKFDLLVSLALANFSLRRYDESLRVLNLASSFPLRSKRGEHVLSNTVFSIFHNVDFNVRLNNIDMFVNPFINMGDYESARLVYSIFYQDFVEGIIKKERAILAALEITLKEISKNYSRYASDPKERMKVAVHKSGYADALVAVGNRYPSIYDLRQIAVDAYLDSVPDYASLSQRFARNAISSLLPVWLTLTADDVIEYASKVYYTTMLYGDVNDRMFVFSGVAMAAQKLKLSKEKAFSALIPKHIFLSQTEKRMIEVGFGLAYSTIISDSIELPNPFFNKTSKENSSNKEVGGKREGEGEGKKRE